MTTFPQQAAAGGALIPTSRSFEAGDFPIKTYKAQNGAEHRILYGSKRTGMKLSLTYANILDVDADQFLDHYDTVKGSFNTFLLANIGENSGSARGGWQGANNALTANRTGAAYRYESPPQIVQVRPGVSTVTVNLIGVL